MTSLRVPIERPVLLVLLLFLTTLGGCENEHVARLRAVGDDETAGTVTTTEPDQASDFNAEITLCRRIGRRSGRPIGESEEFYIDEKSAVQGVVRFDQVEPGRTHTVHLVWVKPDGKELYRRYADVVVIDRVATDGAPVDVPEDERYEARITWKKAENLHYARNKSVIGAEPGFTLTSKFNISTRKQRDTGDYRLQVYLDRRLLLEKGFSVLPPLEG